LGYGLFEFLRVKFHGANFVDNNDAALFEGLGDGFGSDVVEVVEVNVVFAYLWTKSVYVSQPPMFDVGLNPRFQSPPARCFSRTS